MQERSVTLGVERGRFRPAVGDPRSPPPPNVAFVTFPSLEDAPCSSSKPESAPRPQKLSRRISACARSSCAWDRDVERAPGQDLSRRQVPRRTAAPGLEKPVVRQPCAGSSIDRVREFGRLGRCPRDRQPVAGDHQGHRFPVPRLASPARVQGFRASRHGPLNRRASNPFVERFQQMGRSCHRRIPGASLARRALSSDAPFLSRAHFPRGLLPFPLPLPSPLPLPLPLPSPLPLPLPSPLPSPFPLPSCTIGTFTTPSPCTGQ